MDMLDIVIGITLAIIFIGIASPIGFLIWAIFSKNPFGKKQVNEIPVKKNSVPAIITILKNFRRKSWQIGLLLILIGLLIGGSSAHYYLTTRNPKFTSQEIEALVKKDITIQNNCGVDYCEDIHYIGDGIWKGIARITVQSNVPHTFRGYTYYPRHSSSISWCYYEKIQVTEIISSYTLPTNAPATIIVQVPPTETPPYIWLAIALGTILVVGVIFLIMRTFKRPH